MSEQKMALSKLLALVAEAARKVIVSREKHGPAHAETRELFQNFARYVSPELILSSTEIIATLQDIEVMAIDEDDFFRMAAAAGFDVDVPSKNVVAADGGVVGEATESARKLFRLVQLAYRQNMDEGKLFSTPVTPEVSAGECTLFSKDGEIYGSAVFKISHWPACRDTIETTLAILQRKPQGVH